MRIKLIGIVLLISLMIPTFAYAATYYVKSGDSLFKIGQKYGVSAEYVRQTNGLKTSAIYAGQKLWVPDRKVNAINYTVKKGDSLYTIGKKFGTTAEAIKQMNCLKSTQLKPGQALLIPKRASYKPVITAKNTASRGGSSSGSRQTATANKVSTKELTLLAKLVNAESRGEPFEGQVAVAAVVLNRVKSPLFPNTIAGVIYQPGAFTCVTDGQLYLTPSDTAYKAAKQAIAGWDPTNGALYYWNPAKSTSKWVWSRPITFRIGNHVFAK
ncbi:cell wall hydrolase [Bacillota bacterium LX-D]|nr:cell wall hydrolase [Bacillota bacterium LX-D]